MLCQINCSKYHRWNEFVECFVKLRLSQVMVFSPESTMVWLKLESVLAAARRKLENMKVHNIFILLMSMNDHKSRSVGPNSRS